MKKIISLILVVLWMSLIFHLSNEEASKSTKLSNSVIDKTVINIYRGTKNYKKSNESRVVAIFTKPIRKLAHFSEYLVLGILVINLLNVYGVDKRIILYSFIICYLYACSDEVHQLFIDGRSGQIIDTLIDGSGSMVGILLYKRIVLGKKLKNKKN